jgi:hypothetical protein
VIITHHAVQRFRERFAPDLDYKSAKARLTVLFNESHELRGPQLWRYVARRNFWEDCEYYRHQECGVVFAVKLSDDGPLLSTCLPDSPPKKPLVGNRHGGAKYRGRAGLRMEGGYKRTRFRWEDE